MKIALFQNNPAFGEIEQNIKDVSDAVKNKDFDILVLPELFATGYQFKNRDEAFSFADESGSGITFNRIKEMASKHDALII